MRTALLEEFQFGLWYRVMPRSSAMAAMVPAQPSPETVHHPSGRMRA
jgi:hypothetical protein